MADNLETADLEETVKKIKHALTIAERDLGRPVYGQDRDPYQMLDTNGRYLLLDSLVALASAQSTLLIIKHNIPRNGGHSHG
jgi:hypothetical protein